MHRLAAEAQRLQETARHHKREASRHRQAAKAARQLQAQVEAECRRLGIALKIEGEGAIHGHGRRTDP